MPTAPTFEVVDALPGKKYRARRVAVEQLTALRDTCLANPGEWVKATPQQLRPDLDAQEIARRKTLIAGFVYRVNSKAAPFDDGYEYEAVQRADSMYVRVATEEDEA
ncbi:hypothetical protein C1Y63_04840 [Corynebacterium sp. 13CS0277]|uniref:hypothetical protein n=1 Tax=Corynebacterium sp. 13CS0277 TaxID=2071994 RepID=UPI000D0402E1|nr:hypothetical protein [Corynebacterium sp. 13CS0277]PRQ11738.1 hypothetical protein C1Y63_04840 [Corynebacterium sp. 13CS0277]